MNKENKKDAFLNAITGTIPIQKSNRNYKSIIKFVFFLRAIPDVTTLYYNTWPSSTRRAMNSHIPVFLQVIHNMEKVL